jgi:hypothetical protein
VTLFELDHEGHGLTALRAGRRIVSLDPFRLTTELAQYITRGTAFALRPGIARVT